MEKKDPNIVEVEEVPSQWVLDLTSSLQRLSEDSENTSQAFPVHLLLDEKLHLEVRDEVLPTVNIEDAVAYLELFLDTHHLDIHLSDTMTGEISDLLASYKRQAGQESEKSDFVESRLKVYYYVFDKHSPYAEVRASVPNTDDPALPVETFRVWVIGLGLVAIFASMNQFFSARWPSIYIDSLVCQVVSYPIGVAFARFLPTQKFSLLKWSFTLNPGPFNQKEHMLITCMANVGISLVYAHWIFEIQILKMFFDQPWARNKLYQYCISLSMQCLGYGLAGIARSCLVFPDYCIWPHNLSTIVLNRSLHEKRSGVQFRFWGVLFTRYRYFLILGGIYFVYHLIGPGFLFGALENFNWPTWIAPQNKVVALIFGGADGLGLNPFPTLSWDRISLLCDPMVTPFFTVVNLFAGMLFSGLLLNLPIYLTNTWYAGYLPFNSNKLYNRHGQRAQIALIVDERGNLDIEKYRQNGPFYATGTYAVKFAVFFACYTASITHCALFHSRQIWSGFKSLFSRKYRVENQKDVHNRLMRVYPEVPHWWYLLVMAASFAMAAAALGIYVPEAPIWLLCFACGISLILVVPLGVIEALTYCHINLNVISELVGGFVVPGKAIAMNMFKSYGCMVLYAAIAFSGDLKLGHYSKVPPRSMFRAQIAATFICVICTLSVMNWQLDNVPRICEPDQPQKMVCMSTHTFFTSSIIWGTLGPARMYGPKGIYHTCVYGFLIGALLPIPVYVLSRWRYPRLRTIYIPSFLVGAIAWAPYNITGIFPGLCVAWLFNVFIKRRYFSWWASYNYITSSALSVGMGFSAVFVYFAFSHHGISADWWGNKIPYDGVDAKGIRWLETPEGGFGPGPGEFE